MTPRLQVVPLPGDEYLLVLDQVGEEETAVLSEQWSGGEPLKAAHVGAKGILVFAFRVDVVPNA